LISHLHNFITAEDGLTPTQTEKPPVCTTRTKAAFDYVNISKGIEPINFLLKHNKIKQFQYTFSPPKSISKTLIEDLMVGATTYPFAWNEYLT
jgi:hypothetical protein